MNDARLEFRAANLEYTIKQYPEEALKELDRMDMEEDMVGFVENAWKYIDPNPYKLS